MERGLLWLPLLIGFGVLAGLGWVEYQKVEAYRVWAQSFERAKYDLLAMLGWQGRRLTWGKPTRQGPVAVQSADLDQVRQIQLQVDGQRFDLVGLDPPQARLPESGKQIQLILLPQQQGIPFSDLTLALAWGRKLAEAIDGETEETDHSQA